MAVGRSLDLQPLNRLTPWTFIKSQFGVIVSNTVTTRQQTVQSPHFSCPRWSTYLGRLHRSTLPCSAMGATLTRHQRSRLRVEYYRPCPHADGARWSRSPWKHGRICRISPLRSTSGPHLPCTSSTQRVRVSNSHTSTSPSSPLSTKL